MADPAEQQARRLAELASAQAVRALCAMVGNDGDSVDLNELGD